MEITFKNSQRDCPIDGRKLRHIIRRALVEEFSDFEGEACFHLVTKKRMAAVNQQFLQHEGPTDVITFDLAEDPQRILFLAEIYICPAVACDQAQEFETTWQDELVRYHIHALLHLQGYDDLTPQALKLMKREEERIMTKLRSEHRLADLERT